MSQACILMCLWVGLAEDMRTRAWPHLLAGLGDGGGDPGAAEDDGNGL